MKKSLYLSAPTLPRGAETPSMSAGAPSNSILRMQNNLSIDKTEPAHPLKPYNALPLLPPEEDFDQ